MNKLRLIGLISVTLMCLVSGSVPANASSTQTIKNLDFSITLAKSVKLVKKGCSSFTVKYKVGVRAQGSVAGYATILISNSNEDIAGFTILSWGLSDEKKWPASGSVKIKYCREDWIAPDGSAVAGVDPGVMDLAFYTKWSDGVSTRDSSNSGFLKFTK